MIVATPGLVRTRLTFLFMPRRQPEPELFTRGLIVRLGAARACRYALPVPLPPDAE